MRIGLASLRCKNNDPAFNMRQIGAAMKQASGKADLLCFGEAVFQGFDALCWDYETDRERAFARDSETFARLKEWTRLYGVALLFGYIEREEQALYSSCAVLDRGEVLFNYRRISKDWKEYTRTDSHYKEGDAVGSFVFRGKKCTVALCGDLWDAPERFLTDGLLLWPVFICYTPEEWEEGVCGEYAAQAGRAAADVLMINPVCRESSCRGGAYHFRNGGVKEYLPMDREEILFVSID